MKGDIRTSYLLRDLDPRLASFSRTEASGSLVKLLKPVGCTMFYPNAATLPVLVKYDHSQSGSQHFTVGELWPAASLHFLR